MSKFRVINRTTRQEHIFNSEEIDRFFHIYYDEQTDTIKRKNLMSDYAISSIKYEEAKRYNFISDIVVSLAAVTLIIWITNIVLQWN